MTDPRSYKWWPGLTFCLAAFAILVVAQLSEALIPWETVYNPGIAFGLNPSLWLTYLLSAGLIIAILTWFFSTSRFGHLWALALGLIVGGGISNIADRIRFHGQVADYIHIGQIGVINIADISIGLGIIMALIFLSYAKR